MNVNIRTALIWAGALLLVLAGTAFAHAALVSSDPPDGGTLDHTPYTMTATYDEGLTPNGSSIVVRNSGGAEVMSGTVSPSDDKVMTVELPSLPPGQYIARWTAVTADDLGVTRGTISFNVATAATATAPTAQPTRSPDVTITVPYTLASSPGEIILVFVLAGLAIGGVVALLILRRRQ